MEVCFNELLRCEDTFSASELEQRWYTSHVNPDSVLDREILRERDEVGKELHGMGAAGIEDEFQDRNLRARSQRSVECVQPVVTTLIVARLSYARRWGFDPLLSLGRWRLDFWSSGNCIVYPPELPWVLVFNVGIKCFLGFESVETSVKSQQGLRLRRTYTREGQFSHLKGTLECWFLICTAVLLMTWLQVQHLYVF